MTTDVLNIGSTNQVFIDGMFLDTSAGVAIVTHEPTRRQEPCLIADRPWEEGIGGYNTVMHRNGAYHLWYTVTGAAWDLNCIGYATSDDGITWHKPDLGFATELSGGRNNVVLGFGAGGVAGGLGDVSCHVFEDPHHEQPFAMLARLHPTQGLSLLRSADGIEWEQTGDTVLDDGREYDAQGIFVGEDFHLDSQNVVFWDDRLGAWVAYVRRNFSRPGQYRTIARGTAQDLGGFAHPREMAVVLAADPRDPPGPATSRIDYYTNATIRYPWAANAYFMFPSVYYKYDGWFGDAWGEEALNAGVMDTGFAASRDGIRWNQFDRAPFVRLGTRHSYDSASIYMAWGMVPSGQHPDGELFMYYGGSDHNHGWGRKDKHGERNDRILTNADLHPTAGKGTSGIGRIAIRRDGFTSIRGDYDGGLFVTPPLQFEGSRLCVNVDTSAVGELLFELQDAQGAPLPGLSLRDCMPVHSVNDTSVQVRWRDNPCLDVLAGRPVRLHVRIRGADLYAFRFSA